MKVIIAACPKCNTILRPVDLDYERIGLAVKLPAERIHY